MLRAAEGSPGNFIELRQDPSAALSMTDFPLTHFQDFEYTLLDSGVCGSAFGTTKRLTAKG